MLEKLLRSLGGKLGVKLAARFLREVAEGKRGPGLQRAYLFAIGKKRVTAALLGLAAVVTAGAGYPQESLYIFTAGGVLYSLGLLDKGWREQPPILEEWRGIPAYRFLADNAATITTGLATLWAFVQVGQCGQLDCEVASRILLGAGAGLAYLGMADAAWKSKPPAIAPAAKA